jgi:hypothetical protein
MRRVVISAFFAILAAGIPLAAAHAQSVRLLSETNAWSAYTTDDGSGKICFAMTRPTATDPVPDGLGDAYFYLTNRTADGARAEANLIAGYGFAPDTFATLTVGSQSFPLFTAGDSAWLDDISQSEALITAIRGGSTMTIEGVTDDGTTVRQTFSLMGATAAAREIDGEC